MGARVDMKRELWHAFLLKLITDLDKKFDLVPGALSLCACIDEFLTIYFDNFESKYWGLWWHLEHTLRQVMLLQLCEYL